QMISDWLQEPAMSKRYACNLSMKKTVYVLLLFVLLLSLGIVQVIFIEKFNFLLPRLAHCVLFLFELVTFLIFIFGIYPEKPGMIVPFGVAEVLRVIVLTALIVYYIILNFSSDSFDLMARAVGHLFFVLAAHIFIVSLVIATYRTLRNRGASLYCPPPQVHTTGHHVIVLEQPIEEAMYGKKPQR
ncbi:hypothetical protein PFISCL1PPCAC_23733, partial [Pristionchus fissidentatus]